MIPKDLDEVSAWIRQRQSVFPASYTGEAVADEVIKELLENANSAPSHKHTEPWRFKIVRTESLETFVEFCQRVYKEKHDEATYVERKYKKLRTKVLNCSHILIICMQPDMESRVPEWEELAAVGAAVQNIYLSLAPAGLGGYWSSPKYLMDSIGEYVELQKGERCLGFFYIGVRADTIPPAVIKRPLEEKTSWI